MGPDVLILSADNLLPSEPGGWQTMMTAFLSRCREPGRYAIAAPGYGTAGRWTERDVGGRMIPHLRLDGRWGWFWRSRRFGSFLSTLRLLRTLRAFPTVYSHGPELLLPFIFGRYPGRLVLHVLGDLDAEARHARNSLFRRFARPYRWLALWVMRRCDVVLWVDGTQISTLPPAVASRSRPLGTFFDSDVFSPNGRVRPRGQRVRLLTISRFTPLKRIDVILRAVAAAVVAGEDWELVACGGGPEEDRLRRLVAELGIAERVTWHTNHLSAAELAELMRSADVGLLVSRAEGSPFVVKEMLATGLPVVVSNVGDNRVVVDDGVSGVVLDRVDPASVRDGVLRALALGDAAREAAAPSVAPFTVERWVEQLEAVLAS